MSGKAELLDRITVQGMSSTAGPELDAGDAG